MVRGLWVVLLGVLAFSGAGLEARRVSEGCCIPRLRVGLPSQAAGLRAPPGFEVVEVADSKLANDIFCMTFDPRGRVVVSGRGYIRILTDGRAIEFAPSPRDGAQGLLWEGANLFVIGDGGLRHYHTRDGDHADGPSELIRKMHTGGEHHAHALRRGPDGWLYLLCGNATGIDRSFAQLPTSPIRYPVAGCVLRFTADLKKSEIVADGFRNTYGMDFSPDGELFTFDSDNERCVSLPWYEPTRFYHVLPGGHYGWLAPQRAEFWRLPPYFPDVVAPVGTFGRGSPTGVACYRHAQFPAKYRGGFFLADWTFGRIYFARLKRQGASYTCEKETFLEAVGDNGFAPTALAVHPRTGDLYVSIGGRGTRGAVYRIRYPAGMKGIDPQEVARLQPAPRSLDWRPGIREELLERATAKNLLERVRALEGIRRHRVEFTAEQIAGVVRANRGETDRYVRQAVERLGGDLVIDRGITLNTVRQMQRSLGDFTGRRGHVFEGYTLRPASGGRKPPDNPPQSGGLRPPLARAFPSGDPDLDRELSRTLAILEDPDPHTLAKVADRLTPDSDPIEDIHYLIVLARLSAPRSEAITKRVADTLVSLDRKLTARKLNRDTNWPLRVGELLKELTARDPQLAATVLAHPEFGRADHALLARMPGFDRRRAAAIFLRKTKGDPDYPWNAVLISLLGELPAEKSLPVFRRLWGRAGLDSAILPQLAPYADPADREKFLGGLSSPDLKTVRLCLEALEKLPTRAGGHDLLLMIQSLRRLPAGREGDGLRRDFIHHLEKVTGQHDLKDAAAWTAWFVRSHPALSARLTNADGVDVAGWARRLAKIDWPAGDAAQGRLVFVKADCAACHSGSQAIGPDLQGVAGRFSRDDLFTAIVQPSKDVSPRYRTTLLETTAGKVYQGIILYEAVDGLILQSGPAATVRLRGDQIAERRTSPVSLMPTGLLDRLGDGDIADLYAYLRSLGAK
jgi:putative heme-binding domain-containing protein